MVRVTIFERMPSPDGHSIERVFREVRRALPDGYSDVVVQCPTPQHSLWWLLRGIAQAWNCRGEVNHIVGDVHYVALGLPGGKAILTVHDLNRLDGLSGLRKRLYKWLYFSVPLRRCLFVTAISQYTAERIIKLFPLAAPKIVIIPDCVPDRLLPVPKPFNSECPRILQVGTMPHKNLEGVAHALAGIACVLHIIGRLSETQLRLLEDMNIRYEQDCNVPDEDLRRAYQEADIVTFASLTEGFGLPIIEAQSVGRPVITSKFAPMSEVSGGAAALVDPFQPAEIRAAVIRLIQNEDERRSLVERGFENAKRFSPESVSSAYCRLYELIAAHAY